MKGGGRQNLFKNQKRQFNARWAVTNRVGIRDPQKGIATGPRDPLGIPKVIDTGPRDGSKVGLTGALGIPMDSKRESSGLKDP